jgi:hypothetical protein
MSQAGGGMGAMGGGIVLEMGAGTGGSSGSANGGTANGGTSGSGGMPSIALHTCPAAVDAACPPKAMAGNVQVSDAASVAALQGVTSIDGELSIRTADGLDALSCLETVGDNLQVDLFGADGDVSLWGLRNLKSIGGGIDISDSFGDVYPDCAFSKVEKLGEQYATGGAVESDGGLAGELDVTLLKEVRHIRIRNSKLTRIKLPNNLSMLEMGQFALEGNGALAEVTGFSGVTIKQSSIQIAGAYSVRIVDNPLLPNCRALELAGLFKAAGYTDASMTIMGNAPCM